MAVTVLRVATSEQNLGTCFKAQMRLCSLMCPSRMSTVHTQRKGGDGSGLCGKGGRAPPSRRCFLPIQHLLW